MNSKFVIVLALAASLSTEAVAQAELARAKSCTACHAANDKLLGPAFKQVAAKYAGQEDAENKLVQKVVRGGAGAWGPIPMPANPDLSEADARSLVRWVLAHK